ncbi:MAG: hypothetical protein UT82_C0005G0031 [Parcubacteria group bacterium GW2011_GWB1_40_14]|nr:MAG: hypothetical protein UT82_C0005G0031 [Parcubacteria group bacterium GW2011_GWB1_40_14]
MIEKTKNFIFKALLLNNELEALEEIGVISKQIPIIGNDGDSKKEGMISIEDFSSQIRLNAIKMSSIYTVFFAFENSVRELIKERLSERRGIDWWKKFVSKPTRKKVQERQEKDDKNKWHSPRAKDDISYADFGDMSDIITKNWIYFDDLFPSQDWIKTRLDDLEQSRNVIAHNNVLSERDIQRIIMYLQDWLSQVG